MAENFPHVTHHFKKNPENGVFSVSSVTPIIRLSFAGSTVFMQTGKVFDEGGNVVKELPGWFYDEVAKVTDQALLESGFKTRPTAPTAKKD